MAIYLESDESKQREQNISTPSSSCAIVASVSPSPEHPNKDFSSTFDSPEYQEMEFPDSMNVDDEVGETRMNDTKKLKLILQNELDELISELEKVEKPEDLKKAIRTVRHSKSLIALQRS